MRIIIVGGGIGGFTAAIALLRAGHEPHVYERAPEPREVGAGISLWSCALAALASIDAAGPVLARGEHVRRFELRTSRGRTLQALDAPALQVRPDLPAALLIHRAELLQALVEQLPRELLHFSHECRCVGQDQFGVRALFATSQGPLHTSADVLIGADGIHSVVRASLHGAQPARYSGYTCWRGIAEVSDTLVPPGALAEIWGRGRRFGIARIGQGRVYWWATVNAPRDAPLSPEEPARSFADWAEPVPSLIAATPRGAAIRSDIIDRPPDPAWGSGRVTLLGDAAHATTPNLGMGGCMAIEDAAVLARHLARTPAPQALRDFERERWGRTTAITRGSWRLGRIGQVQSRIACALRNSVAAAVPARLVASRQKRLMRFAG